MQLALSNHTILASAAVPRAPFRFVANGIDNFAEPP
jgi:hypothetical protein